MEKLKGDDIRFTDMPFVRLSLALMAGISIGYWVTPHLHIYSIICSAAFFAFLLFLGGVLITKLRTYKHYSLLSLLFYLFLFFWGWARTWQPDPKVQVEHFSNHASDALVGYIDNEPTITAKTIRFPMQVTHAVEGGEVVPRKGKLIISVQRDSSSRNADTFNYGNRLVTTANYRVVRPSYNPNEFNYQNYLINQGIWHQSYVPIEDIKIIGKNHGNYIIQSALRLRKKMVEKFDNTFADKDVQSIASTLVLGYRSELDRELLNTFSVTGTIHVLSVSGLHVGIIFSVFSFLLLWKRKSKWMWLKALGLILLIWLYALITGLSPSVLRASIMLSLGILALSIVRRNNIYNTIAFSAFVLLLYNPRFIADIGFQLSYLSVLGIVYLYPKFNSLFQDSHFTFRTLWSYISVSLAAQLATFPLVTFYFYFFPVYFLPANLFILLPAALILYLGILVLLLPEGWILQSAAWLLEHTINITKEVLVYFENLPYSSLNLTWNKSWHFLLLYTLILAVIFFIYYKKKQALYVVYVGFFALGLDWSIRKINDMKTNSITIYNAGKNTAIGIFANERTFLYTDFANEKSTSFQYSVEPHLNALAKKARFVKPSDTLVHDEVFIRDRFIQIGNKSLFIYDDDRQLQGAIKVDILYIKNNTLSSLAEIRNHVHFDKVLLDATNAWWYVKKIEEEAKEMNQALYVLKENNAYVW